MKIFECFMLKNNKNIFFLKLPYHPKKSKTEKDLIQFHDNSIQKMKFFKKTKKMIIFQNERKKDF